MDKLINSLLFIVVLLFNIACEKTIYVEIPVETDSGSGSQGSIATCSIYYSSVSYIDGEPYVEVAGKVKNKGPHKIISTMVVFGTNGGGGGVSGVTPSTLEVNEIGDWYGGPVPGSWVNSKSVSFSQGY
jgi:hypothetical protein